MLLDTSGCPQLQQQVGHPTTSLSVISVILGSHCLGSAPIQGQRMPPHVHRRGDLPTQSLLLLGITSREELSSFLGASKKPPAGGLGQGVGSTFEPWKASFELIRVPASVFRHVEAPESSDHHAFSELCPYKTDFFSRHGTHTLFGQGAAESAHHDAEEQESPEGLQASAVRGSVAQKGQASSPSCCSCSSSPSCSGCRPSCRLRASGPGSRAVLHRLTSP